MKCPVDESTLVMSERQGIEIDYCPRCRGVWLDRGELDKIIERAEPQAATPPPAAAPAAPTAAPQPAPPPRDWRYDSDEYPAVRPGGHYGDYEGHYGRRRKKRGFLGELFDD